MYSIENLTKISATTFRARSESQPNRDPYLITVGPHGYTCECPAGQYGRRCKHVRTLLRGRTIWNVLQAAKPEPAEHCNGMDGWCSYPRFRLWQAVSDMAWQEDDTPLSPIGYAGMRQMYLCNDCRAWGEELLRRAGNAARRFDHRAAGVTTPAFE